MIVRKKCLISFKNKSYKIIGVTARNLLSVKDVSDVNLFDYVQFIIIIFFKKNF